MLSSDSLGAILQPVAAEVRGGAGAAVELKATATENERFVTRITSALVDEPLPDRVQTWLVRQLDRGASREWVAAAVTRSVPGRQAEVANTYRHLLHREPTPRETRLHMGESGRGTDQLIVIWRIAQSAEYYRDRGGATDAGYVDALAADLLGRAPTETEAAAWLGALQRGVPRNRIAADLLRGPAYRDAASRQIALHASPRIENPALVASISSAWNGPQRLTQAKARMFGSEEFLARLISPAPERSLPPVVADPATTPASGYPITPGFNLATAWNRIAPMNVTLGNLESIGAWSDGSYWLGTTDSGLVHFDLVAGTSTTIWGGVAMSIAPISGSEAWLIGSDQWQQGPVYIGTVDTKGTLTKVADLPGGAEPTQIAALADGTVWVLSQSNDVFVHDAGSDSWSPLDDDGFTINQISIGSATNIRAVGESQGAATLLGWTAGSGWSEDSTFSGASTLMVSATADGSVWVVADGIVFLKPPGGTWKAVPNQKPAGSVLMMAATDQNRMAAGLLDVDQFLSVLSVGVVDRQAVPFPPMNAGEQAGYDAINKAFGIVEPGGIRALYDDATGDFQTWLDDLQDNRVPAPPDVSPEDWKAITSQIATELNDVIGVNSLFTQLNNLNTAIGIVNDGTLSAAVTVVGLTATEQSNNALSLAIEGMFEAALTGIAAALSGGASVAASLIASGVTSLIGDLTSTPNPTPNTRLDETYVKLSATMTDLFKMNLANNGTRQTTILQDYGMLSAVGNAINTGLWDWEDESGSKLADSTTDAFNLFFYQALIPAKWQIVYMHDYICDLYTCPTFKSPDYATYEVVLERGQTSVLEDVYFVNRIGASTNPFNNPSPFPTELLFTTLWGLGVAESDFYTSQNGWDLKTLDAT